MVNVRRKVEERMRSEEVGEGGSSTVLSNSHTSFQSARYWRYEISRYWKLL